MTCHRQYTFAFGGELDSEHVLHQLERACEDSWWFSGPAVFFSQEEWVVTFHVCARDQWWAHSRAMKLMEASLYKLKVPTPVPVWETLPPHTNRGYAWKT